MTRENAKKWSKEIKAWGEGKNLWRWYDQKWYKHLEYDLEFINDKPYNYVIEDRHFEARKAYALGKPIESRDGIVKNNWKPCPSPTWSYELEYRPKPFKWYETVSKENPISCWAWDHENNYDIPRLITGYEKKMYTTDTLSWKNAKPIKPEECWQGDES